MRAEPRDEGMENLANETAEMFNIPIEEARNRIQALFESGLLDGLQAEDPQFQIRVDVFLAIPSESYKHLRGTGSELSIKETV